MISSATGLHAPPPSAAADNRRSGHRRQDHGTGHGSRSVGERATGRRRGIGDLDNHGIAQGRTPTAGRVVGGQSRCAVNARGSAGRDRIAADHADAYTIQGNPHVGTQSEGLLGGGGDIHGGRDGPARPVENGRSGALLNAHELGQGGCGQNTQDHDHHDQLDQRKAGLLFHCLPLTSNTANAQAPLARACAFVVRSAAGGNDGRNGWRLGCGGRGIGERASRRRRSIADLDIQDTA